VSHSRVSSEELVDSEESGVGSEDVDGGSVEPAEARASRVPSANLALAREAGATETVSAQGTRVGQERLLTVWTSPEIRRGV
jgi:hypothetical protein